MIQPYVVPAEHYPIYRDTAGTLSYWIDWQPGQVASQDAARYSRKRRQQRRFHAGHIFTSGVPSLGIERIHLNLYVFENTRNPMQQGTEVTVLRSSEFLP